MIVIESRAARRIVGRLDRGASLLEALLAVCREQQVRSGQLRATGAVESIQLTAYDAAARAWKPGRTFSGGLEVVSLDGHLSESGGQLALDASATLTREGENGIEVLGGRVVQGRVLVLEFVIDALDDVVLRRSTDPATGRGCWSEAIPVPTSALAAAAAPPAVPARAATPPAATAPSWTDVVEASARQPSLPEPDEEEALEEEVELEPGDVLVHPTFGRCEVQRIEGGDEFAHVRLRNGRLVRLSLDVIKLEAAGREGGRRVFRARIDD